MWTLPDRPLNPFSEADLDRAFQGRIEPVRIPFTYRAGLVAMVGSLVLLQAVYVALVICAAWLTYKSLTLVPTILATMNLTWITVLAMGGPPLIGGIVTFFLFKPLLSKVPDTSEPMDLRREDALVLFLLVERVCCMIGAPVPARIEVNLEVNAFASLRRGWRGLASDDLTLTIGLPLLGGLTVRQFTGVIAHEFGHFTQRAGMRGAFVASHLLHWFERVVHERDTYDLWLAKQTQKRGMTVRSILYAAEGVIKLSRAILRGLLWIASWISASYSRQIELDADRHEAALVGGDTLAGTEHRLALLSAASQSAWSDIDRFSILGRLPDNFPALVHHHDARISPDAREDILRSEMGKETEGWASHPSIRDRIASVRTVKGLLTEALDQPATSLLPDFAALCRSATRHHFRPCLDNDGDQRMLVSFPEYLAGIVAAQERQEAMEAVFPKASMPWRWFVLPEDHHAIELAALEMRHDGDAAFGRILDQSTKRSTALEFMRAGGRVPAAFFGLSSEKVREVRCDADASRDSLRAEAEKLRSAYRGSACRLQTCNLELRQEYRAISAEQSVLIDLNHEAEAARYLLSYLEYLDPERASLAKEATHQRLYTLCREIIARLDSVPCSVRLPGLEPSSMGRQVLPGDRTTVFESTAPLDLAEVILARADELARHLLGELCLAPGRQCKEMAT